MTARPAESRRLLTRPACGIESKYLLTGMVRCRVGGGSLVVRSHQHGRRRVFAYACSSYHLRGRTVCANKHELPERAANAAVPATIEQDLLRPEVIEHALTSAMEQLTASGPNLEAKRAQLAAVEESTRVAAVHPEVMMQDLRKRLEERRALLLRQVAQARQVLRKLLVGQIVSRLTRTRQAVFSGPLGAHFDRPKCAPRASVRMESAASRTRRDSISRK